MHPALLFATVLASSGEKLGPELWPQPEFNAFTGLTLGTGWSDGGGVASCDGSHGGTLSDLSRSGATPIVAGRTYKVVYTIVTLSFGSLYPRVGNTDASSIPTEPGTYTRYIVAATTTAPRIRANQNAVGSIDNVSIKEVL